MIYKYSYINCTCDKTITACSRKFYMIEERFIYRTFHACDLAAMGLSEEAINSYKKAANFLSFYVF